MAYDPASTVARPLLALAQNSNNNYSHRRRGLWRRPRTLLFAGAALFVVGATTVYLQPDITDVFTRPEYFHHDEGNPPPPPHGHGGWPWGRPPPPPPTHWDPNARPPPLDAEDADAPPPPVTHPEKSVNVPNEHTPAAEAAVSALLAAQPATLPSARARYTQKTGRPPPRGFDAFFKFATAPERQCLVDAEAYSALYEDFAPFWAVERLSPGWFRSRVGVVERRMAEGDSRGMTALRVREGKVVRPDYQGTYFDGDWENTIGKFSKHLPDLTVLVNGRDEPRVVFDVAPLLAAANASSSSHPDLDNLTALHDRTPFSFCPPSTAQFFRGRRGCGFPLPSSAAPSGKETDSGIGVIEDEDRRRQAGEGEERARDPGEAISFLHSPSSAEFTTDLVPVLSMAKIADVDAGNGVGGTLGETATTAERHSCFADVRMVGEFYYRNSWWAGKFEWADDTRWADKKDVLYWRGKSNGGHIHGTNYKSFPRFRLMDLARRPETAHLFDVKITNWHDSHCTTADCDADAIKAAYAIGGEVTPREEAFGYKYLLDVDGNSFSGRYLGLLRAGGGLVFKSSAFTEFFTPWLRPYEHYIPVRPDLADLVEKVRWARENDAEVRRIQEAGRVFAERVLSDAQNDCYWFAVMMEWGALWESGTRE